MPSALTIESFSLKKSIPTGINNIKITVHDIKLALLMLQPDLKARRNPSSMPFRTIPKTIMDQLTFFISLKKSMFCFMKGSASIQTAEAVRYVTSKETTGCML